MRSYCGRTAAVLFAGLFMLCACQLTQDAQSLLSPRFQRSEIFGFIAGFGTTFAALPDLASMLRRKSSAGIKPRMAAIMGVFQVLWIYYGLLIDARPVVVWNVLAVLVNFLNVATWTYYVRKERKLKPGS